MCLAKDDPSSMLLCGDGSSAGCDRGYHVQCLDTGLDFVPEGDWFCAECQPEEHDHDHDPEQPDDR